MYAYIYMYIYLYIYIYTGICNRGARIEDINCGRVLQKGRQRNLP
jgi:hypothetical protein